MDRVHSAFLTTKFTIKHYKPVSVIWGKISNCRVKGTLKKELCLCNMQISVLLRTKRKKTKNGYRILRTNFASQVLPMSLQFYRLTVVFYDPSHDLWLESHTK